jgi:hypothetical protein
LACLERLSSDLERVLGETLPDDEVEDRTEVQQRPPDLRGYGAA